MNKTAELCAQRETLKAELLALSAGPGKGMHDGGYPSPDYLKLMGPRSAAMDKCLVALIAERDRKGPARFSRDNVWIWGGPTPYWGGSMEADTSVKGARYFGLDNVVYVYGAVNDATLALHKSCKKLLCQLTQINRTPDAQRESNEENAEQLSRLSLKHPNIRGGIIDDLLGNYGYSISRNEVKKVYEALKKHNPALRLYAVVYVHEMDLPSIRILAPYIDCVNLWVWRKDDLPELDLHVEKCRAAFPGKEIMLGAFMHDYGASDLCQPPELLRFQMNRAARYLAAGKIHDLVILGDREIAKCPEAARTVKTFLDEQFA